MATINYNGMELEEFKERKVFDSPFEMCVWNDNDGLPTVQFVCAVIPYRHVGQVITTNGAYEHCALLPDPPKPRRATNRELSRWLAQGNGEWKLEGPVSEEDKCSSDYVYLEKDENCKLDFDVLVRKWSDTEWHEPTVDYMGLEEYK